MQNPEVWSFREPQSPFQVFFKSSNLPCNNLRSFHFNHLVSVVLPQSLEVPQNLLEFLSDDCEYYKILNLNLSDLLNITFLDNFIRQGYLSLLSIGTRIDCDNCIAVTPTGLLILSLKKDTYQTLGLEGKISHFTKKNKDRYIIKIDLKDLRLQSGKANYDKTKQALDSLETFTVIVSWSPPEESICPSSIAKFLNDLEYSVKVCSPKFKERVYSLKTPTLVENEIDEDDIIDFVEWLGIVSVGGDFTGDAENYVNSYKVPEPNIEAGRVRFLQWRGFYQRDQIMHLIDFLKEYNNNENQPWIAVYIQGFSDAPVTESKEEHHYFTYGDYANLYILNKSRFLCCMQRCSAKSYK